MDFKLWLRNSKGETMSLTCDPFYLERGSFTLNPTYSYATINDQSIVHSNLIKNLNGEILTFEGTTFNQVDWEKARDFILAYPRKFTLNFDDDGTNKTYYCDVELSSSFIDRMNYNTRKMSITMERRTNWIQRKIIHSVATMNPEDSQVYPFTYPLQYALIDRTESVNTVTLENDGHEPCWFRLILPQGGNNPTWGLANQNISGGLLGNFTGQIEVITSKNERGIIYTTGSGSSDVYFARNYDLQNYFTIPIGTSVLNVTNVTGLDYTVILEIERGMI